METSDTESQTTVLSPGPAPRMLTVNTQVRTLQEHFLAFLSSNNPSGFDAEAAANLSKDNIGDLMLLAALRDSLSVESFKSQAKRLKKSSAGAITHTVGLELMARLFGYANWYAAHQSIADGRLINLRKDRDRINMKIFDCASRLQRRPNRGPSPTA